MHCYVHAGTEAVGVCSACGRALCRDCVASDATRLLCRGCASRPLYGFEYRSELSLGNLPFVHVCTGVDPVTQRPKVARGVVAIGNIAVGVFALGGLSLGFFSLGGLSIGILGAVGGAALGFGVSLGGLAVGSVAVGGAAIGYTYALGGAAFGPAVVDGRHCAEAARAFFAQYVPGMLPPHCR